MFGTHRLPVAVSEERGDGTPGDLRALVDDLVGRVEALHADVANLQSARSAAAAASTQVPTTKRSLPTEGEPVDLAVLAEWVENLMVRYAAVADWLRPCWWRHGFVVEELAALRVAWLAVYDTMEPVDATAGVKWHDEAEKCRERTRRKISDGPGCSAVSHKPDEPVTRDTRWSEELALLREHHESGAS